MSTRSLKIAKLKNFMTVRRFSQITFVHVETLALNLENKEAG